jgi:outer membrane protein OmpA-like peptidoglycan-associated protein
LAAGLGVSLSACAPTNDLVYSQFHREAGATMSSHVFGAATVNNTLIQTGQKQYTFDLANRFASEVMTTVNFAFNSATLDAGAQEILREQAAWIRQFPEVRFKVYGHTDAVGSSAYNKRLGLSRAHAVVNYLASQGIDKSRLEAVVSFGETQPLIVTQGRERRNRRTVTDVSGFVEGNPLVMDGKYAQIVYRDYVRSAEAESTLRTLEGSQLELVPE